MCHLGEISFALLLLTDEDTKTIGDMFYLILVKVNAIALKEQISLTSAFGGITHSSAGVRRRVFVPGNKPRSLYMQDFNLMNNLERFERL